MGIIENLIHPIPNQVITQQMQNMNELLNQSRQLLENLREENRRRDEENRRRDEEYRRRDEENRRRDKIILLLFKIMNDPNDNSLKKQLNNLLDDQQNNEAQTDYSDSSKKGKKKN